MADGFFQSAVPEGETGYADIDTSVAHIARVYDYWLGGKDNISQVVGQGSHSGRMPAV